MKLLAAVIPAVAALFVVAPIANAATPGTYKGSPETTTGQVAFVVEKDMVFGFIGPHVSGVDAPIDAKGQFATALPSGGHLAGTITADGSASGSVKTVTGGYNWQAKLAGAEPPLVVPAVGAYAGHDHLKNPIAFTVTDKELLSFHVSGKPLFASALWAAGAFHHDVNGIGAAGTWVSDGVVEGTWWDTTHKAAFVASLSP